MSDNLANVSTEIHSVLFSFIEYCAIRNNKNVDVKEWTFITPTDICRQRNSIDCGVFACIYAYSMLTRRWYDTISEYDSYEVRYWIASVARNGFKKRFGISSKPVAVNIDMDVIPISNIKRSVAVLLEMTKDIKDHAEVTPMVNNKNLISGKSTLKVLIF